MQGPVNTIDLNDYEKLNPIGEGGFGEVFELQNKKTGEIFAGKISLKMYDLNDPKDSLYIHREVETMCRLNHPSILRYHGFSKTNFLGESKPVLNPRINRYIIILLFQGVNRHPNGILPRS